MSTKRLQLNSRWRRLGALAVAAGLLLSTAPLAAHAEPSGNGSVSGVVRSSTELPLADTRVELIATAGEDVLHRTTESDDDGTYSFDDVPPGSYLVFFRGHGATEEAPYGYARAYFGGASTETQASTVTVHADSDTLFVDAELVPAGLLSGGVSGLEGRQAIAAAIPEGWPVPEGPTTDREIAVVDVDEEDGLFSLPTGAGTYTVAVYEYVERERLALAGTAGPFTVASAQVTHDADVSVQELGALQVTFLRSDGSPAVGLSAIASLAHEGSHEAITDENGMAAFPDLLPGDYDISVVPPFESTTYSIVFVRGMPVAGGQTSHLTTDIGDPLPAGWQIDGAVIDREEGIVLLPDGALTITFPDAFDLESATYILGGGDDDPLTGAFTQTDSGAWQATFDPQHMTGTLSLGVRVEYELGLSVQHIIAVALPAVVDEAALTAETRGDVLATASATVGGTVTVSGLEPRGWYYAWWFSTPTGAGWFQADAAGAAALPAPASLAAGAHKLALVDVSRTLVGWAPVTLVAADAGGSGADPALPAALPATGGEVPSAIALAGLLLAAAGATLRIRTARRR